MKLVILINKRLGMSPGKVASQAVHALAHLIARGGSEAGWGHRGDDDFLSAMDDRKVVVLGVEDEAEMAYFIDQAERHSINVGQIVCDAGATEIPPESLTAVAIGPDFDVAFRAAGFDALSTY